MLSTYCMLINNCIGEALEFQMCVGAVRLMKSLEEPGS